MQASSAGYYGKTVEQEHQERVAKLIRDRLHELVSIDRERTSKEAEAIDSIRCFINKKIKELTGIDYKTIHEKATD